MNLVTNAAEAIGSHRGTVTIRTAVSDLAPGDGSNWRPDGEPLAAGPYGSGKE